jgi:NADH-quinone oxidoreductase subunit G
MLLLNHPVDCPSCDQAGECKLQDYWLAYQRTAKRMHDEVVHKPKAVPFGPTVVYDAERCIVCTLCVRVCEELAKDPVLSLRERGNLAEVVLAPGRQLDHPYSLMTAHVCPVGALTPVDFRFKARVWFLRSARTICPGCSTGCNAFLDYDPRTHQVFRHRPRTNLAVNRYWMCDEGMLSYQRMHTGRLLEARVNGKPTTAVQAVAAAAARLIAAKRGELALVLGPQHSVEDNRALLAVARDHLGITDVYVGGRPLGEGDDILRHPDKNPNTRGVIALLGDHLPPRRRASQSQHSRNARTVNVRVDQTDRASKVAECEGEVRADGGLADAPFAAADGDDVACRPQPISARPRRLSRRGRPPGKPGSAMGHWPRPSAVATGANMFLLDPMSTT